MLKKKKLKAIKSDEKVKKKVNKNIKRKYNHVSRKETFPLSYNEKGYIPESLEKLLKFNSKEKCDIKKIGQNQYGWFSNKCLIREGSENIKNSENMNTQSFLSTIAKTLSYNEQKIFKNHYNIDSLKVQKILPKIRNIDQMNADHSSKLS